MVAGWGFLGEHPDVTDRPSPEDAPSGAARLKARWEQRAQSDHRDFYVASHPSWDDEERWRAQARADLDTMLFQLDPTWVRGVQVLEIGCGVGRLARELLPRCAGYTGFDIAPSMIEEARRRVPEGAAFYVSDGLGAPAEVREQKYGLILAVAVFIHCPRSVVEALARDAVGLLAGGGCFRFQLLADHRDSEGISAVPADLAQAETEMQEAEASAPAAVQAEIESDAYMGHAFAYREAEELFGGLGGELQLIRPDAYHIYGELRRG